MKYDFLIVGAGPFGATFARHVADQGRRVLVIDRRGHLAGNCHTDLVEGVHVHRYGPHIFHTANERVWRFVQRFAKFNDYKHRALAVNRGTIYPFPIDLKTLRQIWGVETPAEALKKLESVRRPCENPRSLMEWLLSEIGEELYVLFFRDYSRKQWGRDPARLPASIGRRIPIRVTENDSYFGDGIRFTGIPIGGYTQLTREMLDHPQIDVELGVDYHSRPDAWQRLARQLVYSGKIDEYFDYELGSLEYRSLRIEIRRENGWVQPVAMVNYTDAETPYTRVVEHKHFEPTESPMTILTREFPIEHTPDNDPYYPIRDYKNISQLRGYQQLSRSTKTIFGGRLGSYRYLNMDQAIAEALTKAERCLGSGSSTVLNDELTRPYRVRSPDQEGTEL